MKEDFTSYTLDFSDWLEWYFSFFPLLLPNQNLIFLKDLFLKDQLYQAPSIFFLNTALQLEMFEEMIPTLKKLSV